MRLGPFELRRHATVTAADSFKTPPKEIGASGTVNLHGFLAEMEYNRDLQGHQGQKIYERMISSDGTVQEAIDHITIPVKNADWAVTPPEDPSDDELEQAAFVSQALFEWLEQPWLEHLDNILEYLPFGHAVVEPVWTTREDELRVPMPDRADPVQVPSRQWLTYERFAPRLQQTIYKWHVDHGNLTAITQLVFSNETQGYETLDIPVEQLMVLVHRRRGDDFTGRPLLRAAYKPWVWKELVEKVSAIAVERHGVGMPVAYPPVEAREDDALMKRLEAILGNIRSGAFSYIVAPGPKQTPAMPGYLFEILNPGGTVPDFTNLLNYHRAEIKAAVLARFAELGHAQTGARATGDTQAIVWFAALHSVARYVAGAHRPVIKRLVDANYANVSRYPRLEASGIEARNLQEYAMAMSQLVSSGAVVADESFYGYVRDNIDAPEPDPPPDAEETGEPPVPPQSNGKAPLEQTRQPGEPPLPAQPPAHAGGY